MIYITFCNGTPYELEIIFIISLTGQTRKGNEKQRIPIPSQKSFWEKMKTGDEENHLHSHRLLCSINFFIVYDLRGRETKLVKS